VTKPPPLTARSKPPSVRVAVVPNSGWSTTRTCTPAIGLSLRRVIRPRRTAARSGSIVPSTTPFWIGSWPV
jgi:hypothetical protein